MTGLTMPHNRSQPRPSWWVAPVCFVVVGAFWAGAALLWFVGGAA